jgi:hypothetical protein
MAPTDHENIPYTVNYELLSVLLLDKIKMLETRKKERSIILQELSQRISALENC